MGISVKRAQENLILAQQNYDKSREELDLAKQNLYKAKSNTTFKCVNCKKSSKYKEVTLIGVEYTEKGLGYSDDIDHFSEWNILCPHCNVRHRFLTPTSQEKYEIPMETYTPNWGVAPIKRQSNSYKDAEEFVSKFKSVDYVNNSSLLRNFINL